jgi:hypothetical protein
LDDVGASYHGRQIGTWSELGQQERVDVGRQVHFDEQETPGWIQSSCPCPKFFRGKRQAMHLGAHVHGWLVPCLSQSVWHWRRAGALDIRSFLITASISSTGGQSSRVSSRDQYDEISVWHWRRRNKGRSPSGCRGSESKGAMIPFTTECRSVCLTARSPGEKRRDNA